MDRETVNSIEVLDTGELFLGLEGRGKPMYQHVYREAAGVYWDETRSGFKSTPMKDWSYSQWYKQIVAIVRYIGVELALADDVTWSGVSEEEKAEIERVKAI
ncbi:hypothetical protein [Pseudidiomarina mangrovi]|uniref:hypothetical protein n=1 Tax=Pseudidiomarina mangrovi TaxID=2487133 RepID=UPI000FCCD52E|nr:hypothetical protein [Pseudidiomarina mangrovi]